MLVVMQTDATQADIDRVCSAIKDMGYQAVPMPGGQRTAIGLVGNDGRVDDSRISALPAVAQVERLTNVLYVGRPAYGQAESTVGLFKLDAAGEATRAQVQLGRSSVNTIEVLSGLAEGDQVVLSDMSAWDAYERVRLK